MEHYFTNYSGNCFVSEASKIKGYMKVGLERYVYDTETGIKVDKTFDDSFTDVSFIPENLPLDLIQKIKQALPLIVRFTVASPIYKNKEDYALRVNEVGTLTYDVNVRIVSYEEKNGFFNGEVLDSTVKFN